MKIYLRNLCEKDLDGMYEWMCDLEIRSQFRFKSAPLSKKQVLSFIQESRTDKNNKHYAICNKNDEYLGTISLKKINQIPKTAEYAIVCRKLIQGLGVAKEATHLVLDKAFTEFGLNVVFLNVLKSNETAIQFYEKCGFNLSNELSFISHDDINYNLVYYQIRKQDYYQKETRLLSFQEKGDSRGHLVVAENNKNIPFLIKRIFYMYGTNNEAIRGAHANRRSEFVFIAIKGSVTFLIDDSKKKQTITLAKPNTGLYLPRMIWKEIFNFSSDAIILVLSNELYDPAEYIRDYSQYLRNMEVEL